MKKYEIVAVNVKNKDYFILFAILLVYIILAFYKLGYPAIQCDDGMMASRAYDIYQKGIRALFEIFSKDGWLALGPYHGALDSYLLLPFFKIFNEPMYILRVGMIFYSALGLLFTYLFAKELFNSRIGLLSVLLLAVHPAYIYNSIKQGLYTSVPIMTFTSMGCLFFLFKWYRTKKIRDFLLGSLLIGMGIGTRIWFLWLIISLIALKFILRVPVFQIMKKSKGKLTLIKYILLGLVLFLSGVFTLVHDNIAGKINTLSYLISRIASSDCGVNNLDIINNCHSIMRNLHYILNSQYFFYNEGYFLKIFRVLQLNTVLFLFSFIFITVCIFIKKTQSFSPKRLKFLVFIFLLIFPQTLFTISLPSSHHLLFLLPLMQVTIALVFFQTIQYFNNRKSILSKLLILFLCILLVGNVSIILAYNKEFGETGGKGLFSVKAFDDLSDWLIKQNPEKVVCIEDDYRFVPVVMFLTKNKIRPLDLWLYKSGKLENEVIEQSKEFFNDPDNLYIIGIDDLDSYFRIKEFISNSNMVFIVRKSFTERNGNVVLMAGEIRHKDLAATYLIDDFQYSEPNDRYWYGFLDSEPMFREEVNESKTKVLDLFGGGEFLNIEYMFSNLILDADFRILRKCAGFVFRAKNIENLYMHQLTVPDFSDEPSFVRWHKKVNGRYSVEEQKALPFKIYPNKWYHVRFVLKENNFKLYLNEGRQSGNGNLDMIAKWTDSENFLNEGYIGFRECSSPKGLESEHAQFDNIVIKTIEQ